MYMQRNVHNQDVQYLDQALIILAKRKVYIASAHKLLGMIDVYAIILPPHSGCTVANPRFNNPGVKRTNT